MKHFGRNILIALLAFLLDFHLLLCRKFLDPFPKTVMLKKPFNRFRQLFTTAWQFVPSLVFHSCLALIPRYFFYSRYSESCRYTLPSLRSWSHCCCHCSKTLLPSSFHVLSKQPKTHSGWCPQSSESRKPSLSPLGPPCPQNSYQHLSFSWNQPHLQPTFLHHISIQSCFSTISITKKNKN